MLILTPEYGFWIWFLLVAVLLGTVAIIYFKRYKNSSNKPLQFVFIAVITILLVLFLAFLFAEITILTTINSDIYP